MNTSEYLRKTLKDFDDDFEKEQASETPEEKKWFSTLRKLEIDSVESMLPHDLAKLIHHVHSRRDTLEYGLDEYYSRYFLDQVPKIVKRALKLEPPFIKKTIQGPLKKYIINPTRPHSYTLFKSP